MSTLSPTIQKVIAHFSALPGIGQKTAERLVFYLLKQNHEQTLNFGQALLALKQNIRHCNQCGQYAEQNLCSICADKRRDQTTLCIVAEAVDVAALEKSGQFHGLYHILHGLLNPTEGMTSEKLNLKALENKLKQGYVKEIILALNPTVEGETTNLYLTKLLKKYNIKITKLARGLPQGGDLEYADEVTLANALKGRTII
ncbi:MAG TPA: recombination mediator RecR [bacterium]|nr:recombination mediator RecR [bacterium]